MLGCSVWTFESEILKKSLLLGKVMPDVISRVMAVDKRIRCVTIVDQNGNIKDNKCQEGLKILLEARELRAYVLSAAVRRSMLDRWETEIGKSHWLFSHREKVNVIGFYDMPGGQTVIVTTEPDLDPSKVLDIEKAINSIA